MKSDLKVKYLQYLTQKKQDKGFTLIELLVVIVIVGILSAVALPSFLSQSNRAKESEGQQNVSSINSSQLIFRLQNGSFSTDTGELGLNFGTQTTNYDYALTGDATTAQVLATARDANIRSIAGGVVNDPPTGAESIICINDTIGMNAPTGITFPAAGTGTNAATPIACGSNTTQIK